MPFPDPKQRMRDMLAYAKEALAMTAGKSRANLDRERSLELSLTRLVEIIGEAASRVDSGTQSRLPDIPWGEIVSARNRLIHGYDSVDLDILWAIVQQDLPKLADSLEKALA